MTAMREILLRSFVAFTIAMGTIDAFLIYRRIDENTEELTNSSSITHNNRALNSVNLGWHALNSGRSNETRALLKESSEVTAIKLEDELPETVDCRTQRDQAVSKHKNYSKNGIYVPVCTGTDDHLFDRIQCHRVTGYCWCVKPDSGEPIGGTAIRGAKPDCSSDEPGERETRDIKGCTEKKRVKFFRRFFASLRTEMTMITGEVENVSRLVDEERAIKWKFRQLDANHNDKLERREWKAFRAEMKQWLKVRRCGRNFLRFCDANGDRRITMDEWQRCTIESRPAALQPPTPINPMHILQ